MCWFLARCCCLALVTLSVAPTFTPEAALSVSQKPRFYGIKTGRKAFIYCFTKTDKNVTVEWHKVDPNKPYPPKGKPTEQYKVSTYKKNLTTFTVLAIQKAQLEDSGVYYCKMNNTFGSGTGVKVMQQVDIKKALHYSRMKDGLIIFQALMLAVCIAAAVFRKRTLSEERDSLYEEPETDHIYEGLAIETCGGGLYEELSIYAQAEGTEAPWEKD